LAPCFSTEYRNKPGFRFYAAARFFTPAADCFHESGFLRIAAGQKTVFAELAVKPLLLFNLAEMWYSIRNIQILRNGGGIT